jgi:hypothetical protein
MSSETKKSDTRHATHATTLKAMLEFVPTTQMDEKAQKVYTDKMDGATDDLVRLGLVTQLLIDVGKLGCYAPVKAIFDKRVLSTSTKLNVVDSTPRNALEVFDQIVKQVPKHHLTDEQVETTRKQLDAAVGTPYTCPDIVNDRIFRRLDAWFVEMFVKDGKQKVYERLEWFKICCAILRNVDY